MEPEDILDGVGVRELRIASQQFEDARTKTRSPLVAPFRLVPVFGRQIKALEAQVTTLSDGALFASSSLDRISDRFEDSLASATARLEALSFVGDEAIELRSRIIALDPGPSKGLISSLSDSYNKLDEQLLRLDVDLQRLSDDMAALVDLLEGPTRYLLIASNNAEMRAGSGMFLQAGTLLIEDGEFELEEIQPTLDLMVPAEIAPELSEEQSVLWGSFNPNMEWRNLALTPRFDVSAELATEMWAALGREDVDGVIAVDPAALRALLIGTGPLDIDGEALEADDVINLLTVRQYREFEVEFLEGAERFVSQNIRREQLGRIATEAFRQLGESGVDVPALAEAMRSAARGRHILAWSPDAAQQGVWSDLGIDGTLDESSLMLSLLNGGGSKLDRYVEIAADFSVETDDGAMHGIIDLKITNAAPEGLPEFVYGPYEEFGIAQGTYRGNLAISLPTQAFGVRVVGATRFSAGQDGDSRVIVLPTDVAQSTTESVQIRFDLPESEGKVRIESSARIPAVSWSSDGAEWSDFRPRSLTWDLSGRTALDDAEMTDLS